MQNCEPAVRIPRWAKLFTEFDLRKISPISWLLSLQHPISIPDGYPLVYVVTGFDQKCPFTDSSVPLEITTFMFMYFKMRPFLLGVAYCSIYAAAFFSLSRGLNPWLHWLFGKLTVFWPTRFSAMQWIDASRPSVALTKVTVVLLSSLCDFWEEEEDVRDDEVNPPLAEVSIWSSWPPAKTELLK